jgi:hypothetical protein
MPAKMLLLRTVALVIHKDAKSIAVLADGHAGACATKNVAVVFKPESEQSALNQ